MTCFQVSCEFSESICIEDLTVKDSEYISAVILPMYTFEGGMMDVMYFLVTENHQEMNFDGLYVAPNCI